MWFADYLIDALAHPLETPKRAAAKARSKGEGRKRRRKR
jgi:hypothetical protein